MHVSCDQLDLQDNYHESRVLAGAVKKSGILNYISNQETPAHHPGGYITL